MIQNKTIIDIFTLFFKLYFGKAPIIKDNEEDNETWLYNDSTFGTHIVVDNDLSRFYICAYRQDFDLNSERYSVENFLADMQMIFEEYECRLSMKTISYDEIGNEYSTTLIFRKF